MAGFVSKESNKTYGFTSGTADSVRKLSSFGMYYDDLIIQRRQGAGETETNMGGSGSIGHSVYGGYGSSQWDQRLLAAMAMQDIGGIKALAIYDSNYVSKRDFLRSFSLNDEIVEILDTIADEAIVYDDKNWFCYPDTRGLESILNDSKKEEVVDFIHEQFKKLYVKFGFNNNTKAWNLFRQYLIDGFLAFEIVTDEEGEDVIALNKLDPSTVELSTIVGEDGVEYVVWLQKVGNDNQQRVIYDSSLIYIAYAQNLQMDRVSYVERLVRPLNLLRLIENSKVMWHIMYAQFRMKMTIPIGSNSPQKAKQELSEILNHYKEEIFFNDADGTLSINGRPAIPFFKHFMFPSKDGNSPNVEVIGGQGVDLSNPDFLKYFELKLRRASKIPMSRFGEGGGTFSTAAEGVQRDEVRFSNFVNRLRSGFQEIMLKPLVLQTIMKFPEFQGDHLFKSSIGIKFNRDNSFEVARKVEVMQKRVDTINALLGVPKTKDDSYFDLDFAMENFMNMSRDELRENRQMLKDKEKKAGDQPGDAPAEGAEEGGGAEAESTEAPAL
jgi:hypothetical protein